MAHLRSLVVAIAAATLAACGGGAQQAAQHERAPAPPIAQPGPTTTPPPGGTTTGADPAAAVAPAAEEMFLLAVDLIEQLAAAGATAGSCDETAIALQAVIDRNADAVARLRASADIPEAESEALYRKHEARVAPAFQKFLEITMACADHEGVRAVMQQLEDSEGDADAKAEPAPAP